MIKSVAVVTGASQGIGRATAIRLARDFSAIVLAARNPGELQETAAVKSAGAEPLVRDLDLRQPAAAESLIKDALASFGRIDALLNIAGAVPQIDVFEMTDAQWEDGMALKLHGAAASPFAPGTRSRLRTVPWYSCPAAPRSIPSRALLRSQRPTPPSAPWPKPSPNKVLRMECRLTAWFPAR